MVTLTLYSKNNDADAVEYLLSESESTYEVVQVDKEILMSHRLRSTPCLELKNHKGGPVARSYGFNVSEIMSMVKVQKEEKQCE